MGDNQWDLRLKALFTKTAQDVKRAGRDMRVEAERLLHEVQDPVRQQQLKEGLKDLSLWAKKTAEDMGTLLETSVRKAEGAVREAAEQLRKPPTAGQTPPDVSTHDTPVDTPAVAPPPKAPPKKSIGKRQPGAAAPGGAAARKKTIGKKRKS